MKKSHLNSIFSASVVSLFLLSSCASGIVSTSHSTSIDISHQENIGTGEDAVITCYISGMPHSQTIAYESGVYLKELFSTLAAANTHDPYSAETQQLQQQILEYAEQQGMLPAGMSAEMVFTQLKKQGQIFATNAVNDKTVYPLGIGREMFCNFVATGEGAAFPIIILPRFIPFIMAPIPRLFVCWKTSIGITSVGGLVSGTGFYAVGEQQGFALGFWGIGFSIFLPPIKAYGMFGYALYAKASAENMEYYPPNHLPEITATYPLDGAMYVPLSTSELRFSLSDSDSDLMSYSVTTSPDVGGGNGNMKPDGSYSVPISDLKSSTEYTWYVTASDGMDTVEKEFSFTTEAIAPVVSEERPLDGDRYVPETQIYLSFHLRDPQNDPMSYTVETTPFIGSGSGSGVGEGDITVSISGLEVMTEYRWYVNATDGENPTSETFWFRTGPLMVFDPFEAGWEYRKMITVDHTMVADDLHNFPVLLSVTDSDLRDKAQDDGDDILFMDGSGVATRLYHELEEFDGSTGRVVAWVNASSLSPTVDTICYMYYGNMGSADQQCPEKVWDSNYEAVYHMNDKTVLTILDSTANNHDLTKYVSNSPIESIDGKVGNCQSFDGSNDWMTAPTWSMGSELTVSVWVKAEHDFSDNYYRIYEIEDEASSYDYPAHSLSVSESWQPTFGCDLSTCSNQFIKYSDCVISQNQWYHLGVTRALASRTNLFINGLKATGTIDERSNNWAGAIDYDTGGDFKIGVFKQSSTIPYGASWWGKIDEFRLSSCVRNESWISTEYNSMMYTNNFVSVGPEETGP